MAIVMATIGHGRIARLRWALAPDSGLYYGPVGVVEAQARRRRVSMANSFASSPKRFGARHGFTLLELMVALAVMGVAISVFIQLYNASLDFAKTSVNSRIATAIANEQLHLMQRHPERFLWNISAPGADERFAITLGPDEPKAGNPAVLPSAMPAEVAAVAREEARHSNFRWKAFGELRHNAAYYETTVVVRWTESGREKTLALTSAVTRDKVDAVRRQQAAAETAAEETPEADSDATEGDSPEEEA